MTTGNNLHDLLWYTLYGLASIGVLMVAVAGAGGLAMLFIKFLDRLGEKP